MKYEVDILEDAYLFVEKLPNKLQAKVYRTISLLEMFGYELKDPYVKTIKGTKNLKELRIRFGNNTCRLFFFHFEKKTYIITSGYMKKAQKLSRNEIRKAINIMNKFLEEQNEEN